MAGVSPAKGFVLFAILVCCLVILVDRGLIPEGIPKRIDIWRPRIAIPGNNTEGKVAGEREQPFLPKTETDAEEDEPDAVTRGRSSGEPHVWFSAEGELEVNNTEENVANMSHFRLGCLEMTRHVFRYGDLTQVGYLDPAYHRYAVVGVGAGREVSRQTSKYVFPIPITAMLVRRLRMGTVVIAVDTFERWTTHPLFRHVFLNLCRNPSVVVLFLPAARPENVVMLSQISRVFAGDLLLSLHAEISRQGLDTQLGIPDPSDVIVFTADADYWVLPPNTLPLPPGKDIVALQIGRSFQYQNRTHHMLTMLQGVGMRVSTWHQLVDQLKHKLGRPSRADDIVEYMVAEFGSVGNQTVHKGDNFGWFLDQELTTILVEKWVESRGNESVLFVGRAEQQGGLHRVPGLAKVPLGHYNMTIDVDHVFSAHIDSTVLVFLDPYWHNMVQFLRVVFGPYSRDYQFCISYHSHFREVFDGLYGDQE